MQRHRHLKIIDPTIDKRWDNFVSAHPNGSLYHHSSWMEIVKKSYGYQPLNFIVEDPSGSITAGVPFFLVKNHLKGNQLISLALSDHSDILFNDKKDIDILLNAIMDYSKKSGISNIEMRAYKSTDCFENNLFTKNAVFKNHVLVLDENFQAIQKRFHKSVRRGINKSLASDLEITHGTSAHDMKEFYNLYVLTRKYHGLLPQPYIFFKNLWNVLHPHNMLHLMFARDNSKIIAGIALIEYNKTMYYLYGGSDRRYLNKNPNHLLFLNAIELSIRKDLHYFDFGRTSPDNRGLMEFKQRWGTYEYDITHLTYPNGKESSPHHIKTQKIFTMLKSCCKMAPISVLKFTGNIIYRHFR